MILVDDICQDKIIAVMLTRAMVGSVSGCSLRRVSRKAAFCRDICAGYGDKPLSVWGVSQETLDGAVALCYKYEKLLSKTMKEDVPHE